MHCFSLKHTLPRQECVSLITCLEGNANQLIQWFSTKLLDLFLGVQDRAMGWWDSQCDCHTDHASDSCLLTPNIFIHFQKKKNPPVWYVQLMMIRLFLVPQKTVSVKEMHFSFSLIQSKLTWQPRHSQGANLLQYHRSSPPSSLLLFCSLRCLPSSILVSKKEGVSGTTSILSAPPNHSLGCPKLCSLSHFAQLQAGNAARLAHPPGFTPLFWGFLDSVANAN